MTNLETNSHGIYMYMGGGGDCLFSGLSVEGLTFKFFSGGIFFIHYFHNIVSGGIISETSRPKNMN